MVLRVTGHVVSGGFSHRCQDHKAQSGSFPQQFGKEEFPIGIRQAGQFFLLSCTGFGMPRLSWGPPGAHRGRGEAPRLVHAQVQRFGEQEKVASGERTAFIFSCPSESLCWVICRCIYEDDLFLAMLTPIFIQLLFSSILLTCTSKRR